MADTIQYDEDLMAILENDETVAGTEFDADADYAAPPPPLPDGWHQAKLKNLGVKKNDVIQPFDGPRPWGNIPATFWTQIEASVVDPGGPEDGKRTNRFNVTTHAEARRNNSSAASLVYRAITGNPIPGVKQAAHIGLIVEALKGDEPIVWIKTQLEGESSEASKAYGEAKKAGNVGDLKKPTVFRGQAKFTDETGKVTGVLVDPQTGERVVGRPAILDIKPLSFQPPAK